jgi:membrane-associated protease RseP (regulator of RpoE activity)
VNLVLMFFNLIPIPPLDGSSVLPLSLSNRGLYTYDLLQRYAFPLLIALLWGCRPSSRSTRSAPISGTPSIRSSTCWFRASTLPTGSESDLTPAAPAGAPHFTQMSEPAQDFSAAGAYLEGIEKEDVMTHFPGRSDAAVILLALVLAFAVVAPAAAQHGTLVDMQTGRSWRQP